MKLTPTYKTIEYQGQSHTLHEWAKIKKIPYITLYSRMRDGRTLEQIFGDEKITIGTKKLCPPIEYNGKTLSIAEWSRLLKIPYFTLYKKAKSGMTAEKMFTKKKTKKSK